MTRPALTVLTTPIHSAGRRLYQQARSTLRPLVKPGVPLPYSSPYPGHYAVTRSIVEGLRAIGADFNFNPRRFAELSRVVYAPANEALRQAIALKRRGDIDYLVAGPVNALFSDEADGVLNCPEIDCIIIAAAWARDLYADAPAIQARCRVWPCGVDADAWRPATRSGPPSSAVVYWKSGPHAFCEGVEAVVRAHGLEPTRVATTHGDHARFTAAEYRRLLGAATVAIFLSTFETQGIALAEAWSMDVPTLVWDPRGEAEWDGRSFLAGSSCPYLTPATGRRWQTLAELDATLGSALASLADFHPRDWVLAHMTDAVRARDLWTLVHEGAPAPAVAMGASR